MPLATLAIELLIVSIQNAAGISQIIQNAKEQNRDITPAELASIVDSDTLARAKLVVAIAAAKGPK